MVSVVAIPVADVGSSPQQVHQTQAATDKKADMAPTQSRSVIKLRGPVDYATHLRRFKEDPRKLAVLLDFDGTLAKITQHPKDTVITEEGDLYLRKLTARTDIFTAIISGRGLPDLKDKVRRAGRWWLCDL